MSEYSSSSYGRRGFLARAGAVAGTAAIGGLAGCTSLTGGGSNIDTLNVAYKPVFPFLQRHIMDQQGFFDELGPSVEQTNFADKGLTIVKAYADGDIDLAFMGITPVIKMKHKGIPGKVTAANHKNGFVAMAHEEFVSLWEKHGADAFQKFREQNGRKFRFSTFPKGSVAYILVQYWLREELGVSPDVVEIETLGGAGPVRQSLLTGNADGTFIMEPIPTALQLKDAPFEWLTWSGEFMSGQPGGVMFMHDRLWKDSPDLAQSIVEKHVRATQLINNKPDTAAKAVSQTLGEKLPLKVAKKAVRSKASNYISNPTEIADGTQLFVDEMKSLGQIKQTVETGTIFEPSLHREVSQ
ncbi:ABC transporter substrate-binding protein [Halogeometricum borinquense]|uniref:ABC-type nitrate/sulfonate/bicarbonate transport system, periplasmic component n=1 Tax=Halogeometricum borinquense (strain ATCC 700274 / DSM 11551 / JCM 10706 / KCTC 4070 / PR3) TaxID=469382 RepID=E4NUM4_HALBP|nr:ABC transporter substrate-binding protein [Halogeometricum borinquense]ADQ68744.1 ABC-type nitrate/sulfonate/bicarbonate transport system, periplasmic component [Halogeometricum borinquense DSM 11551]